MGKESKNPNTVGYRWLIWGLLTGTITATFMYVGMPVFKGETIDTRTLILGLVVFNAVFVIIAYAQHLATKRFGRDNSDE